MPEEFNLPKIEEKFLEYWKRNQIFKKSLELNRRGKKFVFFEGPPYANGKPGIHHVLARIYKDVILRYKTMRGYYVPRRAGWDTHGLPVEMAAEKELGLKSKKDIEKFGIKRFNEEAKKAVWLYKDEWEKLTERIGYWLDLKNAYITYEPEYIETLWWAISQIAKKGLLYKGHKVVPWCTRCGTALSSHELALGYKEIEDNSVYVKFKFTARAVADLRGRLRGYTRNNLGQSSVYILSWTTTPWTLPGNVALAVGKDIKYAVVEDRAKKNFYVIAKEIFDDAELKAKHPLHAVFGLYLKSTEYGQPSREKRYQEIGVLMGKDLVGLEYEPLFDVKPLKSDKSYKIYDADFVSTGEGTGVVHTAVMYGEDDYKLGQKVGLPQHHTVDEEGKFTKDVSGLIGFYVKSAETEKKILGQLERNAKLLSTKKYVHEYPYCWRCDTPILYYARTSWFIAMSRLRAKLLAENKKINWLPAHLKTGRFGEWLKEVKDWNLSRERYWGAPLPIWECGKCSSVEFVSGLDDLNGKSEGIKNRYWVMRHGEAGNNVRGLVDSGQGRFGLTEKGRDQVSRSAKKLKKELEKAGEEIDVVIASDIQRTRETAELASSLLGVKKLEFDKRLREILLGELSGCHDNKYHELFPTYESKFEQKPKNGESLRDLRKRTWEFLQDTEKKYKNKDILLVSHEYPIWMLEHAARAWSEKRAIEEKLRRGDDYIKLAEIRPLELVIAPRNESGEVDLHRPFVDDVVLKCAKCKREMRRVSEVVDVWFDSGAMPFAQAHYPFAPAPQTDVERTQNDDDNFLRKSASNPRSSASRLDYPADYIAEGMDQTRGWFYTLLAVATALGKQSPYKNVVSLGLINDKHGRKMSKSKGNIVDPWSVIGKYGADAVRWYFFTVNPPGETKNFDEAEVQKAYRRMHLLAYNSLVFYKTYAGKKVSGPRPASKNILDQWILARLDEATALATKKLDRYEIRDAALEIERFVEDLSRWYIRRSRRRLQRSENQKDYDAASGTLGFVLLSLAKLLAPFTPFLGEYMHSELCPSESVHLDEWPKAARDKRQATRDKKLLEQMAEVRRLASAALARRAETGIKVRQPLGKLKIKNEKLKIGKELLTILANEVNVKKIVFDNKIADEVELDTIITPELKEEGILRELVRMVQELRQKAGLKPKDNIVLMLELPEPSRDIVLRNEDVFKKEIGAKEIEYKIGKFTAEAVMKTEEGGARLAVRKI